MPEDAFDKALRGIRGATEEMRQQAANQEKANIEAWKGIDKTIAEGQLSHIAESLFAKLSRWEIIPDQYKSQISTDISELVTKAQAGDESAQKILEHLRAKLAKAKVDTSMLPNLE